MVAHTKRQDALVDPQTRGEEDEVGCFLVDRLDDELAVIEGDVSNLRPGETNFGSQSEKGEMYN